MITQFLTFITYLFVFFFPLFSLPFTADSYEYNKMFLLVAFDLAFLFLLPLQWIREGKITISRTIFAVPLFLIALLTLISTFLQSPNITVAFTTPLGTSTIIAGFFLYFFLTQIGKETDKETFFLILTIDALIISSYTLFLYTGILPPSLFTPAGSLPPAAIFLGIIAVYLFAKILQDTFVLSAGDAREGLPNEASLALSPTNSGAILKRSLEYASGRTRELKFDHLAIFRIVSFLLIAVTTLLITVHLFTDQKPSILPLQFGWAILLEILKNIRTLALGIGPTNFITAFTLGKPALVNASPIWNIIFTTSSSFFFTLVSETGIFAGILYIVILIKSFKLIIKSIPLLTLLLTLLILPANMTIFILLIVLLALAETERREKIIHLAKTKAVNYLLLIPLLAIIGFLGYLGVRAYAAEFVFKQSLAALVNNEGGKAYTLQKAAIALNPYLDRYHLAFSKTNLALANALAGKQTLTDEERQTLPRFAQLAIVEARNSVILYRTNVINWDNLGRTYAGLTNFAAGSQSWAIQSFEQKLILDPLSPAARLSLGAYYLALDQHENAEFLIRQAIRLKEDYANAHYYLGQLLGKQKKYKEAYQELQITVALLPPGSEDSRKVVLEMNEIAKLTTPEELKQEETPKGGGVSQRLEPISSSSGAIQSNPLSIPTIELPEPPIN